MKRDRILAPSLKSLSSTYSFWPWYTLMSPKPMAVRSMPDWGGREAREKGGGVEGESGFARKTHAGHVDLGHVAAAP